MTCDIMDDVREYEKRAGFEYDETKSKEEATFKIAREQALSSSQARVYLTLSKKGPLTFEAISNMLNIDLSDVCRAILGLQKRGFVDVADAKPFIYPVTCT